MDLGGLKDLFCGERCQARRDARVGAKSTEAQSQLVLSEAAATKASQVGGDSWSPLAVTGVVIGSLVGISLMVVVIKKFAKK